MVAPNWMRERVRTSIRGKSAPIQKKCQRRGGKIGLHFLPAGRMGLIRGPLSLSCGQMTSATYMMLFHSANRHRPGDRDLRVGLLLLTMTNRLGRTIDRARLLCRDLPGESAEKTGAGSHQISIIYRRAQVLRWAIALSAFSVLLISALIIILFVGALLDWQAGVFVVLVFIASMACCSATMVAFLYDINLSLHALRLELQPVKPDL